MIKKKKQKFSLENISDFIIKWIGTTNSLIAHSMFFLLSFLSPWLFGFSVDTVLLILTTVVSLEAIYLAIFIQRSVNQQAKKLEEVEDALDDVEESIDDVEESINTKDGSAGRVSIEKSIEEIIKELKGLRAQVRNKKAVIDN